MNVQVTARHFKAHDSLSEYAKDSLLQLTHFYDGIVRGEVIFSFEKQHHSVKIAEVSLAVYGTTLTGVGKSDDFEKSVDLAIEKLRTRLKKYKEKLHAKDRKGVRKVREKE
jgi:ribosomal subunit interface protein